MILSIGDKFDAVQHYPEGIIFDADPDGLRLYINFNNPTIDEVNTLAIDEPGEIRFVCVKGILFFLIKLDWMEWGDAPYAAQLSEHPFPTLERGEGYKMSFILINRATSRIAALRQINLGVEFSRTLPKSAVKPPSSDVGI